MPSLPLISVIIPTFNYGHFIQQAITSVVLQSYPATEIIVVDDGSTDGTRMRFQNNKHIKYIYQENKGLSAARNTGIANAKGDYFVFLDADDWLEKDALQNNFTVLKNEPAAAFVSGNYYLLRTSTGTCEAVTTKVTHSHYQRLLRSNYIGMHAAVLFQRWAFTNIRYDETLTTCEDYDLYLRMARQYPVCHHEKFIATYNFHSNGLSHQYQKMIACLQKVMQKQIPLVQSEDEKQALSVGMEQWKEYEALQTAVS